MKNTKKYFSLPSKLDGNKIIVSAAIESNNKKTGNMAQIYYLPEDIAPSEASKLGKDKSICGNCPHRRSVGGYCYVVPVHINNHWRAALKVGIEKPNINKPVRLGAYGDPASVPYELNRMIVGHNKYTGYTHQWKTCDQRLQKLCMASVDSISEAFEAQAMGWRTFRIRESKNDAILENEILCPFESKGRKCIDCGLCSGTKIQGRNIVITKH